jgi:hypothetical protein
MLDVVRVATVGAAAISSIGLATSIQVHEPGLIAVNAAMLALEAAYFAWVTRVRRRELA